MFRQVLERIIHIGTKLKNDKSVQKYSKILESIMEVWTNEKGS